MSKAALQASNTTMQAVIANGLINVGTIKLRFGRDIGLSNGSVSFKTCGYYAIDALVTIQPTAIGEVAIKLQHNGVDIPGAIAYGYATEASQNVTIPLSSMIRVVCQNGCPCESIPDTVSIVLVEGPGNVTSVLTEVAKL